MNGYEWWKMSGMEGKKDCRIEEKKTKWRTGVCTGGFVHVQ